MTARIIPELLCTNPITGRRTWLLRHVPSGIEGETASWVVNATTARRFSKEVEMAGLCGVMGNGRQVVWSQIVELKRYLKNDMGFEKVRAFRKGRWVYY